MPRQPRSLKGGLVYHVMNRAAARAQVFHTDADYVAFETVLGQAVERFAMRTLTYVLMPNHFHLVLWPRVGQEEAMSRFMQWLQQTHTQRWHAHNHNAGTGRLYQGRFKAFAVQAEWGAYDALRRVCRYVERNPVRANLVKHAEDWRWGGLWRRIHGTPEDRQLLAAWPEGAYPGDGRWLAMVNSAMREQDEAAVRLSMARGRPLGDDRWVAQAAAAMGLLHTLRPRGRPRRHKKEPDAEAPG